MAATPTSVSRAGGQRQVPVRRRRSHAAVQAAVATAAQHGLGRDGLGARSTERSTIAVRDGDRVERVKIRVRRRIAPENATEIVFHERWLGIPEPGTARARRSVLAPSAALQEDDVGRARRIASDQYDGRLPSRQRPPRAVVVGTVRASIEEEGRGGIARARAAVKAAIKCACCLHRPRARRRARRRRRALPDPALARDFPALRASRWNRAGRVPARRRARR